MTPFTSEYKREAVRLAAGLGDVPQAARDLGIGPKLVHRWKRELRDDGRRAFPRNGSPRDEEGARLKRELKRAREEGATLKRAVCWFGDRPQVSSPSR
ncbi:transposase [Rubrivirga marina]|uniref:transposase n=1 Tax=Rubrivirga marina TaxID=1196024 RepID=UPI000BA975C5